MNRPPMPFDDTMKATFEKAKSFASKIGMNLTASERVEPQMEFVAPLASRCWMHGCGRGGLPFEREYIFAESMEQKAKLISTLIRDGYGHVVARSALAFRDEAIPYTTRRLLR